MIIPGAAEETVSISGLQPEESGRMLCIMNGAGAAFSGGALGYVFWIW